MAGFYAFQEAERRMEMQVAVKFEHQNLMNLTHQTVPQGVLNYLAKTVHQVVRDWISQGAEPSLQAVSTELVPLVETRIALIKSGKSKTAEFAKDHPKETREAVQLLSQRIMSLHKVATGCFVESSYAAAVIRYELDKEIYGLVVPAVHAAFEKYIDELAGASEEEILEGVLNTVRDTLITRIEDKSSVLARSQLQREAQ